MVAATTVLVIIAVIIAALVLWLATVPVKTGFLLGIIAGFLLGATGLASALRDWFAGLLT